MPDPFGGPTPQELFQGLLQWLQGARDAPASQHPQNSAFNAPIAPENRALFGNAAQNFLGDARNSLQGAAQRLFDPETYQGPLGGTKADYSILPSEGPPPNFNLLDFPEWLANLSLEEQNRILNALLSSVDAAGANPLRGSSSVIGDAAAHIGDEIGKRFPGLSGIPRGYGPEDIIEPIVGPSMDDLREFVEALPDLRNPTARSAVDVDLTEIMESMGWDVDDIARFTRGGAEQNPKALQELYEQLNRRLWDPETSAAAREAIKKQMAAIDDVLRPAAREAGEETAEMALRRGLQEGGEGGLGLALRGAAGAARWLPLVGALLDLASLEGEGRQTNRDIFAPDLADRFESREIGVSDLRLLQSERDRRERARARSIGDQRNALRDTSASKVIPAPLGPPARRVQREPTDADRLMLRALKSSPTPRPSQQMGRATPDEQLSRKLLGF